MRANNTYFKKKSKKSTNKYLSHFQIFFMQSIVFILCYSIANLLPAKDAGTPTPPTEPPTCIRFVPTADYMKMDYDDVKNLKIIRDSIGTHGTGTGAFLVGLFVKVPCKR